MNEKEKAIQEILTRYELTKGQHQVMELFSSVINKKTNKQQTVISGLAGSGKSLMLSLMTEICDIKNINYGVATFTGKASDVLRNKGIKNSQTVHSMVYKPIINEDTGKVIGWIKSGTLPYDIIFLDEFSMLPKDIMDDLRTYRIPLFLLGDTGQLPSLGTEDLSVTRNIDIHMTEVVRQAQNNPIIKYANMVREGKSLRKGINERNEDGIFMTLCKTKDTETIDKLKVKVGQVICGKNKTRHQLNQEIRKAKGFSGLLNEKEKLVILRNDKASQVFNGQIIVVNEIKSEVYKDEYGFRCIDAETDLGFLKLSVDSLLNPDFDFQTEIGKHKTYQDEEYLDPVFVNFAYALTCHKSQGSQAESVLLFANDLQFMKFVDKEKGAENLAKSIYTGVTRASKYCFVVL